MTPSETVLHASINTQVTTDKNGRKLVLRRPTALDTLRLFKAAGPVLSHNEPWLAMASLASSVQAVDGVPVPTPTTEMQIEGIIERLGEDGLAAIANALDGDEKDTEIKAHVGNLLGTPS